MLARSVPADAVGDWLMRTTVVLDALAAAVPLLAKVQLMVRLAPGAMADELRVTFCGTRSVGEIILPSATVTEEPPPELNNAAAMSVNPSPLKSPMATSAGPCPTVTLSGLPRVAPLLSSKLTTVACQ